MTTVLSLDTAPAPAPAAAPAPVPSSLAITSIRQSELGAILACGHKFYLERILGYKWVGSRKSMTGTAFHRAMEAVYRSLMIGDRLDWDEAHQFGAENIETALSLASEEVLELDLEAGETLASVIEKSKEAVRLAVEYHKANVFPAIIAKGVPLAVEETVRFEYRGIEITGTVDMLDAEGVLHDWKLTGAPLPKSMPWNYWMQLARYAWFWAYSQGIPFSGISLDVISTSKLKNKAADKRIVEGRPFSDPDMARMIRVGQQSVDQAIDQLKMGYFPRNAINSFQGLCGFCSHSGDRCLNTCS